MSRTTSTLVFVASRYDHKRDFFCMGTNQVLKQKHEVPLLEPTTLKVLCKSQAGTLARKLRADHKLEIEKVSTNVIMFASWRECDVFKFSIRLKHFTQFDRAAPKRINRCELAASLFLAPKAQRTSGSS